MLRVPKLLFAASGTGRTNGPSQSLAPAGASQRRWSRWASRAIRSSSCGGGFTRSGSTFRARVGKRLGFTASEYTVRVCGPASISTAYVPGLTSRSMPTRTCHVRPSRPAGNGARSRLNARARKAGSGSSLAIVKMRTDPGCTVAGGALTRSGAGVEDRSTHHAAIKISRMAPRRLIVPPHASTGFRIGLDGGRRRVARGGRGGGGAAGRSGRARVLRAAPLSPAPGARAGRGGHLSEDRRPACVAEGRRGAGRGLQYYDRSG